MDNINISCSDNLEYGDMDTGASYDDVTTRKTPIDDGGIFENSADVLPKLVSMAEGEDLGLFRDDFPNGSGLESRHDCACPGRETIPVENGFTKRSPLVQNSYTAFLAHSVVDSEFVESILITLEEKGIACCYAKRDFLPGSNTVSCIEDALNKCSFVILFLSNDFLTSPWCEHERDMALHKAAEEREDVVIPILMDVSVQGLPRTIRRLTHIRQNDIDFEGKLLSALGVQDGTFRKTYSDLEETVAILESELEDAKAINKITNETLAAHLLHTKHLEEKIRDYETERFEMQRRNQEL